MPDRLIISKILGLAVLAVTSITSTILFFRRRSKQPIKARPFRVVFFGQVCLLMVMLSGLSNLILSPSYPCLAEFFLEIVPIMFLVNTYVLRSWLLWLHVEVTKRKLILSQDFAKAAKEWKHNWLLRHQFMTRPSFFWKVFFFICFVELCPAIITELVYLSTGEYQHFGPECVTNRYIASVEFWFMLTGVISITLSAWKIRSIKDSFWIFRELLGTAIICILMLTIEAIVWTYSLKEAQELVLVISVIVLFILNCSIPLFLTYKFDRLKEYVKNASPMRKNENLWAKRTRKSKKAAKQKVRINRKAGLYRLEDLLMSEDGRNAFKEHLVNEFAIENYMFWEEAKAFRQKYATGNRENQPLEFQKGAMITALQIYLDYLVLHAPFAVNLPGDVVSRIQRNLNVVIPELYELERTHVAYRITNNEKLENVRFSGTVDVNIFNKAIELSFSLMEVDNFTRFNHNNVEFLQRNECQRV